MTPEMLVLAAATMPRKAPVDLPSEDMAAHLSDFHHMIYGRDLPGELSPHYQRSNAAESKLAERLIRLEATPESVREFTRCRAQLRDYPYWFMLGTLWVSYSEWSSLDLWKRLFSAKRPLCDECLMKPGELAFFDNLPETLPLYRAHRPGEQDWIAYTLDPAIARRFARERGASHISLYKVAKADVLCVFLRRKEMEVLVLDRTKPVLVCNIPAGEADSAPIEATLEK